MARRRASRWTDAQRAEALDLYGTEGLAEARRRTGIPKSTIVGWARDAGVDHAAERSADKEQTAAATAELAVVLDQSRERRTLQLATVAELSLERLVTILEDAALVGAISPRDLVGIFTRANHDLALLTGQATEHQAVEVVFNVPPPAATPPPIIPQDALPALGA